MPVADSKPWERFITPKAKNQFSKAAPLALADPAPFPSLSVHAANRLMFGPRPGDVATIDAQGYDVFVEEQLNFESIDDSACDALVAALPTDTFSESWAQLYDRRSHPTYAEAIKPLTQTRDVHWTRIVNSKRQLWQRMVCFWHDHFNIYGYEYIVRSMFTTWDAVIRQHAMGNFRQFLEATATNPCMLYYLDNYLSTDGGPNENYARELFELHTLGSMNYLVPGGYIDQDVYESSRCLTGWSFDSDNVSAMRGQFTYYNENHDRFIKYVLGTMIPGDQPAMKDGRDVLDMLAFHPGTAKHIAWKLCRHFIGDPPAQSIVDSAAAVFIAEKDAPDQIRRTLRHILNSDEFKNARMTKFKRPIDWVASSMRATNMPYLLHDSFRWLYDPMGQATFSWRTPDGAPEDLAEWATSNNMLRRWNWAFSIVSDWYADYGLTMPVDGIVPAYLQTGREIAQFWADRVLSRTPSPATLQALVDFASDGRNPDLKLPQADRDAKARYTAALCMMTPEFMRR